NTASFRMQENRAFIEGLNQQMASALFYANDGFNPGQFMGLAPRFSDKGAGNAQNIIDMGGSNNANSSQWLIPWGEHVHGIYATDGLRPGQCMGLAPRFSDKGAVNAQNIIDMGGTNNANSSIWLILWGDHVHGIYPKGTTAGLDHKDMGVELVDDGTGRNAKF